MKALKPRLQLETVPLEPVVNEDNGEPYDGSTYRHRVSAARAVAVFGFLARDTVRQAVVRAERLTAELTRTVDRLFAPFPLDEEKKAQRARAVDKRARALAQWLDAQAARDSNGDEVAAVSRWLQCAQTPVDRALDRACRTTASLTAGFADSRGVAVGTTYRARDRPVCRLAGKLSIC